MKTFEEQERHLNMTIKVLKEQIEEFTFRLEPHDTGHLHTTISTLNHRIKELQNEKTSTIELKILAKENSIWNTK